MDSECEAVEGLFFIWIVAALNDFFCRFHCRLFIHEFDVLPVYLFTCMHVHM